MDVLTAMQERRSCREFLQESVDEDLIEKILEAATLAPSPLNMQPWEFIVITSTEAKDKIFAESVRCKEWALEKSGWKWLGGYKVDFLKSAPVIIAVVGDPKKSGGGHVHGRGAFRLSACLCRGHTEHASYGACPGPRGALVHLF